MSARRARLLAPPGPWGAVIAISLVVAGAAASCARASDEAARGGGATPLRIVTVGGAVTETVYALGAGDRIVATDTSSVYPAAVDALPKVGYQRTLPAEGILALEPDLVLGSAEAGPPTTIAQLRSAGVRVELLPAVDTVAGAADRVRAIGAAIGERGAGTELARKLEESGRAATARATARTTPPPRVLFLYARGAGTAMVSGTGTPAAAMIALAGGTTAIRDWDGFRPLSAEAVLAAAPDAILVPARGLASLGGIDGVLALPGLGETPAGRARRVIAIDDLVLLGFGPRLPEGIDALATALAAP